MPANSAWGTDPDQPIDFSDFAAPGEQPPPEVTVVFNPSLDAAIESALNDDWLGDDQYDDSGNLLDAPRKGTPMRFQMGRNPRLQKAFERRRRVVEMKIQGHTYEDIAMQLGFNSIAGARDAFNRAQADVRDVAEEWRDLVLARYERYVNILTPMADTGDIEALDKLIKIQVQIAKVTRMETVQAIGHGAGERGETVKDVVERIGMVEDVNAFLDALPGMVALSPQPVPKFTDDAGNEIHVIQTVSESMTESMADQNVSQ